MEAVPRMPMVSFELKQSLDFVEFGPTLKQYIRDHYGEDPAMYNKSCNELDQLRQTAVHVSHDFMGCSTLKKYYSQLQFLQGRFPLTEMGEAAVPFTWEDVHSGREVTRADIKFEQACILYNIGALHSILGAMDTRQSADGMKVSCTHFQCAAWAFEYLRDHYDCDSMMSEDLASEMLSFQVYLMLAQAQECILEKSMADSRKSTITAKVSAQIVEFYRTSLKDLEKANQHDLLSSKRYKDWKRKIEMKMLFYTCITNFYMGCQSEDQQKWGQCLAYFTLSLEKLTDCQKVAKGESSDVQESLRFTNDVVGGKHQAAKKDNDFVYHDKIPAADTLPEVKGASLVKGIPFNPSDPEVSGPDIFQKLVPMAAHEASSLYSEEKANLLRRIASEISEKNDALNKYVTSLHLDKSQLNPEPERLPQQLLEKCAALSVRQNAIKDLIDSMGAVSNVSTEVDMGIQEIQHLLQDESKAELEFQEKVGKRATNVILTEIAQECGRFEEGHKKGSQSNNDLHKAMNTHITNLKLLSSPLDELQKSLPSVDKERDPEGEEISRQLNMLLSKVEEMKSQRESLEEQFRKSILEDDITGALCKHEGVNKEALFEEQLKKHDQTVTFIRQNLGAQDNILRALTDANAKYASVRMATNDTVQRREQMIRDLINSYDVYEDLMAKSQRGLEFYKKLETNVGRLLARCKAVCKVQQEEREQVYNRLKPKAPPPPRPTVAKPSPQDLQDGFPGGQPSPQGGAPLPVGGTFTPSAGQPLPSVTGMFDGPKLKDYLPFMKPKTFGKKDKSPPISSADPMVQDYMAQHSSLPPSGSASPVHLPHMSGSMPTSPDHFRNRMAARLPDMGVASQPDQQVGPDLTQGHMRQQPMPPSSRGHQGSPLPRGQQGSPDPRLGPGFTSQSQPQFIQPGGQCQTLQSPGVTTEGQRSLGARGQGQVLSSPGMGDRYTQQPSQYVPLDQKWKRDSQPLSSQGQGQQPINQGQSSQMSQPTNMPQQPVNQIQYQYPGQIQGALGMSQTGSPGQGQVPASLAAHASPSSVQQVPMAQPGQYSQGPGGVTFHAQGSQQGQQPHSHQHTVTHPSAAPGQMQSLPGPQFHQQVRPRDVTNTVTAVETPVISPGKEDDASFVQGHGHGVPASGYGQGEAGVGLGQFVSVPGGYSPQGMQSVGPQSSVVSNQQQPLQQIQLQQPQTPQSFPQQPYQQQQATLHPAHRSNQPEHSQAQNYSQYAQQPVIQGQLAPNQLGAHQVLPQQLGSSQQRPVSQQTPGQFPLSQSQPLPAKPQAYQPVSSHSVPVGQHQAFVSQPLPQTVQQYPLPSQQGPQQQSQQFPQQGYHPQQLPQQQPGYQPPQPQQKPPQPQQQLPTQPLQQLPTQPLQQLPAQPLQQQPSGFSQQQPDHSQQQVNSQQQPMHPLHLQQQVPPQSSSQPNLPFSGSQQGLPQQTSLPSQQPQQLYQQPQTQGGQFQSQPQAQGQQTHGRPQFQQPQQPGQIQPQQPGQIQPQQPGQIQPQQPGQIQPQQPGQIQSQYTGQIQPQQPGQIQPQQPGQIQPQQPGQIQPHHTGQIQPQQPGQIQPQHTGQIQPQQQPSFPQQGQGQLPQAQVHLPSQQQQQQPHHSSPAHSQYVPPQVQAGPRFTAPIATAQQTQYSMYAPSATAAQGQGTFQGQVTGIVTQAGYSGQNFVAPQTYSQTSITSTHGQGHGPQPQLQNLGQGLGMQRPPAPSYAETDKNRQMNQIFQDQGPHIPGQISYLGQGQPQNVIQPSQQGYMPQQHSMSGTLPSVPNISIAGPQVGQHVQGQFPGQGQLPGQGSRQIGSQGQGQYQQMYPPGSTGPQAILQPQVLQSEILKPKVPVSTGQGQTIPSQGQGQVQKQTQGQGQDQAAQNYQQGPTTGQNYQQVTTPAQGQVQNFPQGQAPAQNIPAQNFTQGLGTTQNIPQGPVPTQNILPGQTQAPDIPQGPSQTYPQVPTPTQNYQQVPKEQVTRDVTTPQPAPGKTSQDSTVVAGKPKAHTDRQTAKPPGPAPPSKQISLDRQISTASSLDEILSSSPDAKVERSDSVLAPKVLTAQEIQHQKEDQLKNSSVRPQAKDPYKDRSKLDKFVAEVEKLAKFIEGFEKPSCSGPTPLDVQWKEAMEEQDKAGRHQKLAIARCYPMKNRDQDIMPYDESRVLITTLNDDYINASWVNDLSPSCPKFIATQAPLPVTLVDFWLMVYEQGVEVLVALSSEMETGKKFPQHLPTTKGETVHHGPVQLTLQSVKDKLFWTERIMLLRHSETKTGRTLVHLHYNAWPISGFPEKVSHLLQFITEVHSFYRQQRSLMKPIVVHCSNGIGRTGMFMLIYVGMQEVNHGDGVINLPDVVGKMLWRRRNLILKKDQLKYCYEAILYYAQDVLAKEGILVHKASFGDELPKPGVKSQSWEPGEDILFGSMSFTNLQTNVAKLGTKLDTSRLDQKLEALKKGQDIGDVESEIAERSTTPDPKISDAPPIQTFTDSSLPDVVQSPGISIEKKKVEPEAEESDLNVISDIDDKSKQNEGQDKNYDILQDLDMMMRMKIETKESSSLGSIASSQSDKSKSGSKTGSLISSPAHVSRETSSSPQTQKKLENVASSLADLQDPNTFTIGTSSTTKKKIKKADFTGEKNVTQPDPDDPLSSLDPLWSLK